MVKVFKERENLAASLKVGKLQRGMRADSRLQVLGRAMAASWLRAAASREARRPAQLAPLLALLLAPQDTKTVVGKLESLLGAIIHTIFGFIYLAIFNVRRRQRPQHLYLLLCL